MIRKIALRRTLRGRETFYGNVENTEDALRVIGACSEGVLKRAVARLAAEECTAIRPGSVFVFDEKESGIKRWTDGKVWSPSRILGNWLVYRELERKIGRRAGGGPNCSGVPNELKRSGLQVIGSTKGTFIVKGSGGLIKKTFSVPNGDSTTHLVVYLPNEHSPPCNLSVPSDFPELAQIHVHQESAQAQRFRRQKSSSSSSRSSRRSKRLSRKRAASSKQKKLPKRMRTENSDVECETEPRCRPERPLTLRSVSAHTNKGKNSHREDSTDCSSSSEREHSQEEVRPTPPIKIRIPVRRVLFYGKASLSEIGKQETPDLTSDPRIEGINEGPKPQNHEYGSQNNARSDNEGYFSKPLLDSAGYSDVTRSLAVLGQAYNKFASMEESIEVGPPPLPATSPLQALPANQSPFQSEDDYDESLFSCNTASAEIGSEDSYLMVEYMCSPGYSQQQYIMPSFESELPILGI